MKVVSLKKNLIALSFQEMEALVAALGWKPYRVRQILAWIYQRQINDVREMTDLSNPDRILLAEVAALRHLQIVHVQESADGTRKFLLEMEDKNRIETVLIPDRDRLTLCLSSQAGCTLDCGFCLTAQEKFKRNLKPHEIVDQILALQRVLAKGERITNIVIMGMGEPMANLPHVVEALKRITSPEGLGLSPRRITLSTAGLVPQMKKFREMAIPVNLSVSLNATTNEVREKIMPAVNRLYPLEILMDACRDFSLPPRRRITFEYVLMSDLNDSLSDAERLIKLTKGIRCKINLIRFNEFPLSPYRAPSEEQVLRFQKILHEGGLTATIRKSRGRDILAACGQLNSEMASLTKGEMITSVNSI